MAKDANATSNQPEAQEEENKVAEKTKPASHESKVKHDYLRGCSSTKASQTEPPIMISTQTSSETKQNKIKAMTTSQTAHTIRPKLKPSQEVYKLLSKLQTQPRTSSQTNFFRGEGSETKIMKVESQTN